MVYRQRSAKLHHFEGNHKGKGNLLLCASEFDHMKFAQLQPRLPW